MKTYSKEQLIQKLKEIRDKGWIQTGRHGNVGGVGNTLEDLLGIEENNLPIPNAAEWELKCQRIETSSLITLFHMEPSPRALKFVPQTLLPKYGWPHQEAGTKYGGNEMSFRQTITGTVRSDRGFGVIVDYEQKKVLISFDRNFVDKSHRQWIKSVEQRAGLGELSPQPYWGFDDLTHKAGTKLLNCFYVQARTKKEGHKEFFSYEKISVLTKFNPQAFIKGFEMGYLFVDFDARTGHNHGTKFRLRQDKLPELYADVQLV